MRTLLEQTVLESIRKAQMLTAGDRVAVAVSGGADSVALLRLLEALRDELGVTLLVIHFDHSLRGPESTADARFVAELAQARGHEFIVAREDVAAAAQQQGWNLEDAARRLRYAFFQRVIEEGRANLVAVAHTANDQAETVLAHLIRGTGPTGLAGIYPVVGHVVRPLLETGREELREYLRRLSQVWREDSTNHDLRRLRARIREGLLPLLERNFSPGIARHLSELARLSREEAIFWTAFVEDRFQAFAHETGGSLTILIRDLLSPLGSPAPPNAAAPLPDDPWSHPARALTQRLIRRLYTGIRGDCRELSISHVEQVIHLAADSTSGRHLKLPGGIKVLRDFDMLIFGRVRPAQRISRADEALAPPTGYQYVVSLPDRGTATISVRELGSRFSLKVIDWPFPARDTKGDNQAFDAALLRTPLILRNWRPGDAYRPWGGHPARKLKEMFRARRVPGSERACWPVLESAGTVIWTRGLPPAQGFCARQDTRVGVLIEEDRL